MRGSLFFVKKNAAKFLRIYDIWNLKCGKIDRHNHVLPLAAFYLGQWNLSSRNDYFVQFSQFISRDLPSDLLCVICQTRFFFLLSFTVAELPPRIPLGDNAKLRCGIQIGDKSPKTKPKYRTECYKRGDKRQCIVIKMTHFTFHLRFSKAIARNILFNLIGCEFSLNIIWRITNTWSSSLYRTRMPFMIVVRINIANN